MRMLNVCLWPPESSSLVHRRQSHSSWCCTSSSSIHRGREDSAMGECGGGDEDRARRMEGAAEASRWTRACFYSVTTSPSRHF